MEMVVNGKTRESTDLGPIEINPKVNTTAEVAGTVEAGILPQPSSTTLFGSIDTAAAETRCGKGTISWTQAIREGFLELPNDEVPPFVS